MNALQILNKKYKSKVSFQLIALALPVIGSSLFQVACHMIDILFVSRLGNGAVAAVGSAGFYLHMGWALSSLLAIGTGIKVSHLTGQKNICQIKCHMRTAWMGMMGLAVLTLLIIVLKGNTLIGFYQIGNSEIEHAARQYLLVAGTSVLFFFPNALFTSVFISYGDSKTPFRVNILGLVLNMVLDPILIFTAGWGIYGAAAATLFSQFIVSLSFMVQLRRVPALNLSRGTFRPDCLKNIVKLGFSPALQRIIFAVIAIFMARIISGFGITAIAVQRIGLQIEALSFMTVSGFTAAVATLSGQAFGAENHLRQWKSFRAGIGLALAVGSMTTTLFIFFPEFLLLIFINDPASLSLGKDYLIILGYSQIFMCIEMVSTGAFHGWGRTAIPASISILLTALRIPMALVLIHHTGLELSGVWWSITLSSIAKGLITTTFFIFLFKIHFNKTKWTPRKWSSSHVKLDTHIEGQTLAEGSVRN